MMRRLRLLVSLAVGSLFGSMAIPGYAQEAAVPEYVMKTAYLYNFALLTTWPGNQESEDFRICLFGQDDFGSTIEMLRGKYIQQQRVQLVQVTRPEQAKQCQLLFIGDAEPRQVARLMSAIEGQSVLTVTDDKRFQGDVMVYLWEDNQRLAFEVNTDLTKRANLSLSSRMLRLAKRVVLR